MNQNKKEALRQSIFSMIGIVAFLFIKGTTVLFKVFKWVLFVFLILLLIDGLKRLFKRTDFITPEQMGKFDK